MQEEETGDPIHNVGRVIEKDTRSQLWPPLVTHTLTPGHCINITHMPIEKPKIPVRTLLILIRKTPVEFTDKNLLLASSWGIFNFKRTDFLDKIMTVHILGCMGYTFCHMVSYSKEMIY